jgi:hypothetical protein
MIVSGYVGNRHPDRAASCDTGDLRRLQLRDGRCVPQPVGQIIKRARHDDCGGRAGRVELLTGIAGASSRRVRKIVLLA